MAEDSSPVLRGKDLLEDNLEKLDCFLNQLDAKQEEDRGKIEKLEKRVTELEADFGKTELLEERVSVLEIQNIELRDHLNLTIDMLNNVTTILNNQFINKEPTGEVIQTKATTPHEDIKDEDTQPTLEQVYAMYQSQPPDEEGWDEMTAAIKAAQEYEDRQKFTVNGLTGNEWQDLLRLK